MAWSKLRFSITITNTLEDPALVGAGEGEATAVGEGPLLGLVPADSELCAAGPHAAPTSRHTATVRLRITSKTLRSKPREVA
jgi:hypothetical protein